MSDTTAGSEDRVGALNEVQFADSEVDEGTDQPSAEAPKLSAFAQNYLNTVPDNERGIVQRHVQEWDKGFNKYAENVSKKYGQYDQLGTVEEIQQAMTVSRLIAEDPRGATQWLIDNGFGPQQAAQTVANAQQNVAQGQPGQQGVVPQQAGGIPPEIQSELQNYKMALGAMYERFQQDQFQRETEKYQRDIESGLEAARAKHGPLPETLILHLMKGGMEMDEAVNAVVSQIQTGVNQSRAPSAPKVLSSASLPPQAGKSPAEMTDDERKASLAAALQGVMQ
jgi:hypothetical protein